MFLEQSISEHIHFISPIYQYMYILDYYVQNMHAIETVLMCRELGFICQG